MAYGAGLVAGSTSSYREIGGQAGLIFTCQLGVVVLGQLGGERRFLAIHLAAARPAAAGRAACPAATAAPTLAPQQDVDERIQHKVEGDADVGHSKEDPLLVARIGQTHRNGHLLDLHTRVWIKKKERRKECVFVFNKFRNFVFLFRSSSLLNLNLKIKKKKTGF
jgi:hypothetical protein